MQGQWDLASFMPSSYREYAVDFDGDGYRDIWSSETDAIGSVGNYFKRHGWSGEHLVVIPVRLLNESFPVQANTQWKPSKTVKELAENGLNLESIEGVIPQDVMATLIKMDGKDGPEYWLGMNNFYVITRYNHSRMYALAVFQLAEAILRESEKHSHQRS